MTAPTPSRRKIMLGTAGHVDHGKTALVKLLTGCETDTLAEEKQRGLTIDLGFAPCRLADARIVGVVDVPGHVDFIRNMVAGAQGIDVAILVVAADDGIMPQTHEHLHILTFMGLRHGLVALTKIDLVEPARRDFVVNEMRSLLAGTFLEHAPIRPISNITGEGFEGFFDALNGVVNACEDRQSSGIFRLWVDDAFTIRGSGTVITGIPASGSVGINDSIALLPSSLTGHVRRMQVYGQESSVGSAGECVALNVPEIDHEAVHRGMLLCQPETVFPVNMAEGELTALTSLKEPIKDYVEVQLHIGTAAVLAHLAMLEFGEMRAGQKQMVQLRMAESLPVVPGERFVVRANVGAGQSGLGTIGGGRILGVSNSRLRRHKQWTIDMLATRREAIHDPVRWCELILLEQQRPISTKELAQCCHLRLAEVEQVLDKLRSSGSLLRTSSGGLVHSKRISEASAAILTAVQAFHAANPQRAGADPDQLVVQMGGVREVFDLAVESLIQSKRLERQGTVLAQFGWRPKLADPDARLGEQVAATFRKAGWTSPALAELAASLHEPEGRLEKIVRLLVERGVLVQLDERVFMHRDAIDAAEQVVLRLFARAPLFSTMQFRDAVGVSRKYAVPLLDHLDRIRFTVRNGHDRTPGAEAKKLLGPARDE